MMIQPKPYAVDSSGPAEIGIPVAFSPAPVFGDKLQAQLYLRSRETQRAQQSAQFCIAPRCSVTTLQGRKLTEGEPITPADVGGSLVIQQLDRAGILTVVDADTAAIRSAPPSRYTVAASATNTRRGIIARGGSVTAADFATDAVVETPARPAHVSAGGLALPEIPAIPARPASDGTAALAELVRRGVIVDSGEPPKGSKR